MALAEQIGYPVVLKISSVDITHKSDAGGVKVNLKDRAAVEKAYDDIMAAGRAKFPDAISRASPSRAWHVWAPRSSWA